VILLYRARLFLCASVLAAIVLLVLELPISAMLHQRGEIAQASNELSVVASHNASLRADVAALREDSAIAAIAHEEYGLVRPGQLSYVILPGRGDAASSGSLGSTANLPASDLVLNPASAPAASPQKSTAHEPSLLGRVLRRLEFWR